MKIRSIKSLEILDSRGQPTLETVVSLEDGSTGRAAVPSGASTGSYEAHELRDGDAHRFNGQGVLKALENIDKIAEVIVGMDAEDQAGVDQKMIELDGTDDKSNLGANAILSVSLAVACAQAKAEKKPLYQYLTKFNPDFAGKYIMPIPMMNIMNGGAHAGWSIDIQEFMVTPQQKNIKEAVRCGAEIFHALKKLLAKAGYPVTVGDEGGYAPKLAGNEQAMGLIIQAITEAGYKMGKDVKIAIDAASSEFFDDAKKVYDMKADKKIRTSAEMISMYADWAKKYPIESLEDGLAEGDWSGWADLTKALGKKLSLVGDDLFVTNPVILKEGIEKKVGNAILIKLNQIGTVSETVEAMKLAQANKYKLAVSHRSGETCDDFIADLAVGVGADFIKTGSLTQKERKAKYQRLLAIEKEINKK